MIRPAVWWLPALAVLTLAGCKDSGSTGGSPEQPAGPRVVLPSGDDLPDLGDPFSLPPDQGGVTISEPAGWNRQPRSDKYLMAWLEKPRQAYPQLFVRRKPSDQSDSTAENTAAQQEALSKEINGQVVPTTMGGQPAFYYRRKNETRDGLPIFEDYVVTYRNGQRYEVYMIADQTNADSYLPYVLAVAQGIEFGSGESAPPADLVPPEDSVDATDETEGE